MAIHGLRKRPFFPTHCFYVSPGICRRFSPQVLFQTPKKALFRPRSYSKGPNHALEKVLTNETPGIHVWQLEEVVRHRDLFRKESNHFREMYDISVGST